MKRAELLMHVTVKSDSVCSMMCPVELKLKAENHVVSCTFTMLLHTLHTSLWSNAKGRVAHHDMQVHKKILCYIHLHAFTNRQYVRSCNTII